jgi:uncharacterized membrane protein YdbT with pleckstrin-like domain
MSYIQKTLGPGENLMYEASIHWVVYVVPLLICAAGAAMFPMSMLVGGLVLACGFVYLAQVALTNMSTELGVTNRRVVAKWGLVWVKTIEQRLATIDSIQVEQSVLGRLFNYGSIAVSGSGVSMTPIRGISDPLSFQRAVNAAGHQKPGS